MNCVWVYTCAVSGLLLEIQVENVVGYIPGFKATNNFTEGISVHVRLINLGCINS